MQAEPSQSSLIVSNAQQDFLNHAKALKGAELGGLTVALASLPKAVPDKLPCEKRQDFYCDKYCIGFPEGVHLQ